MKMHKAQAYTCSLLVIIGLLFQPAIAQTEKPGASLPQPAPHQTQNAPRLSPRPALPQTSNSSFSKHSGIVPRRKEASYKMTVTNTTQSDIIINAVSSSCMYDNGGGPHRIQPQGSVTITLKDSNNYGANCDGQPKTVSWSVNDRPGTLNFQHQLSGTGDWYSMFYGTPSTQATCENQDCYIPNTVKVSGDTYMTVTFNETW